MAEQAGKKIGKLDDVVEGGTIANTLTDAQKSRLSALDNTINDHLTDGDFSGTLRDLQGNPVPNGRGGYFDHLEEMQDSYKSLQKIKKALEGSLKNPNLSDTDRALLQKGLDKANSYISKIEELFDPYGGIN
ncbi:MAG: polymorphic toxin type 28 domain-containing protein [Bacillota bacterium]|nr:polymorphic toxin type 28 domain-containing protein [Bacillota bacterium]